jgi:hypothetical protein
LARPWFANRATSPSGPLRGTLIIGIRALISHVDTYQTHIAVRSSPVNEWAPHAAAATPAGAVVVEIVKSIRIEVY